MDEIQGLVVFGDVVGSRRNATAAADWLRGLVEELDEAYGDQRLAPFGFTQGDELQGLLIADADPLVAVLHAALGPAARRCFLLTPKPDSPSAKPPVADVFKKSLRVVRFISSSWFQKGRWVDGH